MNETKIEKIYVCQTKVEDNREIIEKILVKFDDDTYSYIKLPSFYDKASSNKKKELRIPLYLFLNRCMKVLTDQDNSSKSYLKNENVIVVYSNDTELETYVDKNIEKLVIEENKKYIKYNNSLGLMGSVGAAVSLLGTNAMTSTLGIFYSFMSVHCFRDVIRIHEENNQLLKLNETNVARKLRLYFSYLMIALNIGLSISNLKVSYDSFLETKITIEKNNDILDKYNNIVSQQEEILNQLDNPFSANSDLLVTTDDAVLNILMEAFNLNPFLNEKDLEIALSLEKYIKDNPYLDYEELYVKFSSVGIIHFESEFQEDKYVFGSYSDEFNIASIYKIDTLSEDTYVNILQHELIHSTGTIDNIMLNEGMTSLLQCEYFDNGIVQDAYCDHVLITKIFCELIGSDKMLEAYSKNDMNIIKNEMLKLNSNEEDYNNLMNKLEECGNLFKEGNENYYKEIGNVSLFIEPYLKISIGNFLLDTDIVFKTDRIVTYESCLGKNTVVTGIIYFNKDSQENEKVND